MSKTIIKISVIGSLVIIFVLAAVFSVSKVSSVGFSLTSPSPSSTATKSPDYEGDGQGRAIVTIDDGDSGSNIASKLLAQDVVASRDAYLNISRSDVRSASITPGTYVLAQKMSAQSAFNIIVGQQGYSRIIVIPDGFRASQVLDRLVARTSVTKEDLDTAISSGLIGLPASANNNVEGYIAPSTYAFPENFTAGDMLSVMIFQRLSQLQEKGITPENYNKVLTTASLIQVEAGNTQDAYKVSRVIQNRLDKNMKLQFDSTVSYATNSFDITTTSQQRNSDSPYNTYRVTGLPPAPINNPNLESLDAALNPEPGNWLYFVTVNPDTGETLFADTDVQHAENVKQFQAWLRGE